MTLLDILLHNSIRFIILIAIFAGIDWYCWFTIHSHFRPVSRFFTIVYLFLVVIGVVVLVLGVALFIKQAGDQTIFSNFQMGLLFLLLIPKLGFAIVSFIGDVGRLIMFVIRWAFTSGTVRTFPARHDLQIILAISFAALLFVFSVHGVLFGRSKFTVHRHEVFIKNLPQSFDGFTITQISDIHVGSFSSPSELKKGFQLANDLNSDLLVFTGDIVNTMANEVEPFLTDFSKLRAREGKYAILGNHDYGDYYRWESQTDKFNNLKHLKELESAAGFCLLNNDAVRITRNGESIYLVGVENWGQPPFPRYGNFEKAMRTVPNGASVILLSHDPSHWEAEVLPSKRVDLMLSGHTHGLQFGFETPWFSWSPAQWKYPYWAGLYTRDNFSLYVNRGFGFVAFPARVGIWPEITQLVLRCK